MKYAAKEKKSLKQLNENNAVYQTSLKEITHPAEYPVIIHHSQYGYDVYCPTLQGCHSQGDTVEEAIKNIKDAIKTYLEMIDQETAKEVKDSKDYAYFEVRVGK